MNFMCTRDAEATPFTLICFGGLKLHSKYSSYVFQYVCVLIIYTPEYFLYIYYINIIFSYTIDTTSNTFHGSVARLRDAIMQDQDEFITRNANFEDVAVMANDKAILEDIGFNTDLHIANQEVETQI